MMEWAVPDCVAAMSSIARDACMKAAECEKCAATSRDPVIRQYWIELAKDWWDIARLREQLDADFTDLARKEN